MESLEDRVRRKRLRILVIDDEDPIRRAMAFKLESMFGALVVDFGTSIQAVESFCEDNAYDIIFLDLAMPGTNGIETFRQLRKIDPNCRVVMMSAYQYREEWRKASSLNVELLSKPFRKEYITELLLNIGSDHVDLVAGSQIADSNVRVFICCAHEDMDRISKLYEWLESERVTPWLYTNDLIPGERWRPRIEREIRESSLFVCCLSTVSIAKSGFLQKEIDMALEVAGEFSEGEIFFVPAKLEECPLPERMKDFFCVNLFEERGFEGLRKTLRLKISRKESSAS